MLAMASPRLVTDVAALLFTVTLCLRGSITRQCKIGSSLMVSSFLGVTHTWNEIGLSFGPTTPAAGMTVNMLHTDCGQPGVGENVSLRQRQ